MSDLDTNQQGGMPPKQSPFKPIQPSGTNPPPFMAAPRTVILKKPSALRAVPPHAPDAAPAPAAPAQAPAAPVAAPTPAPAPAAAIPAADKPSAVTPIPSGIVLTHEQAAKKMTARINVASATAPISPIIPPPHRAPDEPPKTIRLRSPIKEAPPAPAPAPSKTQTSSFTPVQPPVTKSKTSRITLDTALSSAPSLPNHSEPPKTIRLKRPGDMAQPPVPNVPIKPPTTNIPLPPLPSETPPSPIKLATPETAEPKPAEEPSPTRKKTIKVRRPGAGASEHKLTLNKDAAAELENGIENLQSLSAPDMTVASRGPDKANPVFIVAAVIAIIITINLMWVFAAQAFGPQAAVADFATISGPTFPTPPGAQTINY